MIRSNLKRNLVNFLPSGLMLPTFYNWLKNKKLNFLSAVLIICSIIVSFSLAQASSSLNPTLAQPTASQITTITIDPSKIKEDLPQAYQIGTFTNWKQKFIKDKFFSEMKTGQFRFDVGWGFFAYTKNYDDFLNHLSNYDDALQEQINQGKKPLIQISIMPLWLSRDPSQEPTQSPPNGWLKGNAMPPYDYQTWSDIIYQIVHHYQVEKGWDLNYSLWNEPDLPEYWGGYKWEYFELYKYSVKGARLADANAKIGGPTVSDWLRERTDEKVSPPPKSMLYEWIQYANQTSLPEIGLERLPIDFVNFHLYGAEGRGIPDVTTTIRSWLKEFNYNPSTPIHIDEWNSWPKWSESLIGAGWPDQRRDTEFGAAYGIDILKGMANAGVDYPYYFLLQDGLSYNWPEETPILDEFFGYFGMITRNGVIKPVYNAFKLISALDPIEISQNQGPVWDPSIISISTASEKQDKFSLIVANNPKTPYSAAVSYLEYLGYTNEDLTKYHLADDFLRKIYEGEINIDDLPIGDKEKTDLKNALRIYEEAEFYLTNPKTIEVKLVNAPFKTGKVVYERYLIDSSHSNSYSVKDKIQKEFDLIRQNGDNLAISYLLQKEYDPKEIEETVLLYHYDPVAALAMVKQFLEPKKTDFLTAFKIRDVSINYYSSLKAQEIDEWPEVKLNKVEEKTFTAAESYTKRLVLEPNSVTLLTLRVADNFQVKKKSGTDKMR